VLAHLLERREPASVKEVAEALFDESAAAILTRVRASLEALVRRSLVERLRQGTGVFYQAAGHAIVEEPVEGEPAVPEAQD
jgi:Fe2+ or Zn2+ uptake regulation protein